MIVSTSEKLTVWCLPRNSPKAEEVERVSVECPHCGEEALCVELDRSEDAEVKLLEVDH